MSIVQLDAPEALVTDAEVSPTASLAIARLTPLTDADWPGRLTATIDFQGCAWKCTHCQTPELRDPSVPGALSWDDVLDALDERRGMVDAVVLSGGEPTRQPALPAAIADLKARGLEVGLLTCGAYPSRLAAVLPDVDWVALEIKGMPERHRSVSRGIDGGAKAWLSLELILDAGVPHEVRFTVDPTVHSREDVHEVAREVIRRGASAPVLVQARTRGTSQEFRSALRGRGIYDVIAIDDLPDLERR
ncbi:anaerobic ribonucleoside-triphosphate reductase activating protein [Demequina pelophila]|uniref:anaerobic ribonucleoside-triphosphate reductase activating protein n=1 Tax=Demequina pelophila TaxID=1638984 RepID=UPI000783E0E7|nr:anaerobic ribonucleoside-triphosphate reductase activating protein [Demequina pelophila]